ncbi:hypothetical protein ACQPU1_11905 [Clostridium paraputrificum]|uniref:hypothetical protein n=1 Tax=Clostridium paraputrificum TaxID=29363 RepID=UPI003D351256
MKKSFKIVSIFAFILLGTAFFVGCGASKIEKGIEKGKSQIEEGNYTEAKDTFSDLLVDIKDEDKKKEVEEYVNSADRLINSKASFDAGLLALNNKEYKSAIDSLKLVIEEDKKNIEEAKLKLEEASKGFSDEIIAAARSLMGEEKFDEALSKLQEAKTVYENSEFDTVIQEVQGKKDESIAAKNAAASKAQSSTTESNFEKAIREGKIISAKDAEAGTAASKAKIEEARKKAQEKVNKIQNR